LDAGCGTGANLKLINLLDYHAVGLDLSLEGLQLASSRENVKGKLCCASVEKLPFVSNSFDGIINIDVLYLLSDAQEKASLLELKRVLKPGGVLVVNLPAYEWLGGEHDQAVSAKRRYTASKLKRKLLAAGFNLVRLEYRYMLFLPALAVFRRLFRPGKMDPSTAKSDLTMTLGPMNNLLTFIARAEEYLGRVMIRPFGTSVCAVARSPR
jgi:SAM-dependent methyltransferase